MKVIFGKQKAEQLAERMAVLELDTFFQEGLPEPVTAYTVLDNESVPIQEFSELENYVKIHNTMMEEYRDRNWKYVEQALEHLSGRWGGLLDEFYHALGTRVSEFKEHEPPEDWTGVIINTPAQ